MTNKLCELPRDEKTFIYFKEYIQAFESSDPQKAIFDFENSIQAKEIDDHLFRCGKTREDTTEIINWIEKNAKAFRDYLNTIKLAYLVWTSANKWRDITFQEFTELEDHINSVRVFFETIF